MESFEEHGTCRPSRASRAIISALSGPAVHEMLAARGKTTLKAGDMVPDCGLATLVYEEGCQKRYSCGFSEC